MSRTIVGLADKVLAIEPAYAICVRWAGCTRKICFA